jgi:hypothetical protein
MADPANTSAQAVEPTLKVSPIVYTSADHSVLQTTARPDIPDDLAHFLLADSTKDIHAAKQQHQQTRSTEEFTKNRVLTVVEHDVPGTRKSFLVVGYRTAVQDLSRRITGSSEFVGIAIEKPEKAGAALDAYKAIAKSLSEEGKFENATKNSWSGQRRLSTELLSNDDARIETVNTEGIMGERERFATGRALRVAADVPAGQVLASLEHFRDTGHAPSFEKTGPGVVGKFTPHVDTPAPKPFDISVTTAVAGKKLPDRLPVPGSKVPVPGSRPNDRPAQLGKPEPQPIDISVPTEVANEELPQRVKVPQRGSLGATPADRSAQPGPGRVRVPEKKQETAASTGSQSPQNTPPTR